MSNSPSGSRPEQVRRIVEAECAGTLTILLDELDGLLLGGPNLYSTADFSLPGGVALRCTLVLERFDPACLVP